MSEKPTIILLESNSRVLKTQEIISEYLDSIGTAASLENPVTVVVKEKPSDRPAEVDFGGSRNFPPILFHDAVSQGGIREPGYGSRSRHMPILEELTPFKQGISYSNIKNGFQTLPRASGSTEVRSRGKEVRVHTSIDNYQDVVRIIHVDSSTMTDKRVVCESGTQTPHYSNDDFPQQASVLKLLNTAGSLCSTDLSHSPRSSESVDVTFASTSPSMPSSPVNTNSLADMIQNDMDDDDDGDQYQPVIELGDLKEMQIAELMVQMAASAKDNGKSLNPEPEIEKTPNSPLEPENIFTCKVCSSQFTRKGNLLRHMNLHDEYKRKSRTPVSEPKKYPCKVCGRSFTRPSHVRYHMKTHDRSLPGRPNDALKKGFECKDCHKSFIKRCSLDQHRINCHNKRMCICAICNKSYTDFEKHLKTHTSEKNKCEECDYVARYPKDLVKHKYTHMGIKPFKCSVCQRGFSSKKHMLEHETKHSSDPDYADKGTIKCTKCDCVFIKQKELLMHMNIKHPTTFRCKECPETFNDPRTLAAHSAAHSGENPFQCIRCKRRFALISKFNSHMKNMPNCANEIPIHLAGKRKFDLKAKAEAMKNQITNVLTFAGK